MNANPSKPQLTDIQVSLNNINNTQGSVRRVLNILKKQPYLPADEIAERESLSAIELNTICKIIQTTEGLQKELISSDNRDYVSTVKNVFGDEQYTIVFFVGLYCPARCDFCPSVKIHEDGYRELFRFQGKTPGAKKLTRDDFERIFSDIDKMTQSGTKVNIKISGGLEPFTDPKTVSWILDLANQRGINTTIFTNGMLLKIKKNQELALKCSNLRISLSTSDPDSYKQAYFGDHDKNKEVATLDELKNTMSTLIKVRDESKSKTRIGLNTVLGEFNLHEIKPLVLNAAAINIDYIELKGEYFQEKSALWFDKLEASLKNISTHLNGGKIGNTEINFTGSLGRNNFFNNIPEGRCRASDQIKHKTFINPFGECTPIHYWAYPSCESDTNNSLLTGALSNHTGLLEIRNKKTLLPELNYSKLNPFELIISLESTRLRRDRRFGISSDCNPYLSKIPMNDTADILKVTNSNGA